LEFLADYGLFLAKTITLLVGFMVLVGSLVSAGAKLKRAERKGHIEVEKLNEHYHEMKEALLSVTQTEEEYKTHLKEEKKREKAEKKLKQKKSISTDPQTAAKKRLFVFDFHGDIRASDTTAMEQVISSILSVATSEDEVVVRLESAGGMVHSYGLAASQLARFRTKNIPLTVCVDRVAASGGYMMACIGNKILCAPFAMVGSIGVIAQIPNFHRLLKKYDIDYEQITAGEYKRTLTIFGENTDKGRSKFAEEIQDTHELFKEFVQEYRPSVKIQDVATGEVWFGLRAMDKGLVDTIRTSEDYLMEQAETVELFKVTYVEKRTLPERLGLAASYAFGSVIDTLLDKDRQSRFYR